MKPINNIIYISTNFTTNFKINSFNSSTNLNHFKNNNQIYCKNFLIYLLLLKYKNNFFLKSSIFVKKHKKKVFTILRSPYRHKLARHQIAINRYFLNSSVNISLNEIIRFKNFNKIISLINFLKKFNKILESNLIFTNSIKLSLPVSYCNNFVIVKY